MERGVGGTNLLKTTRLFDFLENTKKPRTCNFCSILGERVYIICTPFRSEQSKQSFKPRLCDFFRKFRKRSPTPRIRPHPNGDIYFRLVDVANTLEISRSSDLLQIQKVFVKNESSKNRGALDPKGVVKLYTPTKGGTQELAFSND